MQCHYNGTVPRCMYDACVQELTMAMSIFCSIDCTYQWIYYHFVVLLVISPYEHHCTVQSNGVAANILGTEYATTHIIRPTRPKNRFHGRMWSAMVATTVNRVQSYLKRGCIPRSTCWPSAMQRTWQSQQMKSVSVDDQLISLLVGVAKCWLSSIVLQQTQCTWMIYGTELVIEETFWGT